MLRLPFVVLIIAITCALVSKLLGNFWRAPNINKTHPTVCLCFWVKANEDIEAWRRCVSDAFIKAKHPERVRVVAFVECSQPHDVGCFDYSDILFIYVRKKNGKANKRRIARRLKTSTGCIVYMSIPATMISKWDKRVTSVNSVC